MSIISAKELKALKKPEERLNYIRLEGDTSVDILTNILNMKLKEAAGKQFSTFHIENFHKLNKISQDRLLEMLSEADFDCDYSYHAPSGFECDVNVSW